MSTKHYRKLELGTYDLPDDAMMLTEDILRMELVIDLLSKLNPTSLSNTQDAGYQIRRKLVTMVQAWKTFAWDKRRRMYLAGKPLKRRVEEPIWKIILNAMEQPKV